MGGRWCSIKHPVLIWHPQTFISLGSTKTALITAAVGYDKVIVAVTNWLQVFVKGFNAWFPAGICATTQVAIM
jgi:hypothetical protein